MHGCWGNSASSCLACFRFCWCFTEMMNLQTSEELVSFGIHVSARLALVLFRPPVPPSPPPLVQLLSALSVSFPVDAPQHEAPSRGDHPGC